MVQILSEAFIWFAHETGILGEIRKYQEVGLWALLVVGVAAGIFGFRTYRVLFAMLVFMFIATLSSVLLRERTTWGNVVTFFSVVGVITAFLSCFWHKLGACALSALVGGCIGWAIFHTAWAMLLTGLFALVLTFNFPVVGICLWTTLSGVWVLCDLLGAYAGVGTLRYEAAVLAVLLGFAFQMWFNRRQDIFQKVRPAWMTRRLEERARKKAHAEGISQGN